MNNEKWVIVCMFGGWDCVGQVVENDATGVKLINCATLRQWGTTNGIGELFSGPKSGTILDLMPLPDGETFDIVRGGVIWVYPVSTTAWNKVLSPKK